MAVLQPEGDALTVSRGGHAGVAIAGPGVGVVRDRKARFAAGAVGVERVFDHVVTGGADGMDEELAGELGQAEAGADVGAVDRDAADASGRALFPLGDDAALRVEQAQPQADMFCAIAGPVVGRDQPRVEPGAAGFAGVAEEGVVGGEIGLLEVARRLRQHLGRQLQRIERNHLHAGGDHEADPRLDAPGIERGDQQRAAGGVRQVGQRHGGDPGADLADLRDVMHEQLARRGQGRVHGPERGRDAVRIIDGERALESSGERGGGFGHQGMGKRLVDDVAARAGIEGLDVEHIASIP